MSIKKFSLLSEYAQSLYVEFTEYKRKEWNFEQFKIYLENQGWIVQITPDFYKTGVNFNWQVLIWDRSGKSHDWISDYSTGMYGGNGEYKTSYSALVYGTLRALELFCLYKTIDRELNRFLGESENRNLLEIVSDYGREASFFTVDQEWWKYERTTAKEYLEYIKNRLKEIKKWKMSVVDA